MTKKNGKKVTTARQWKARRAEILEDFAKWVDAHGSFMAAVAAGPAYKLLGKRDLGTSGNYLTDAMPPVTQLIGGELAWRQHTSGHSAAENWPTFISWASQFIKGPTVRATLPATGKTR